VAFFLANNHHDWDKMNRHADAGCLNQSATGWTMMPNFSDSETCFLLKPGRAARVAALPANGAMIFGVAKAINREHKIAIARL